MNLAVQLYSSISNPLGVPGVWPANVVELGDSTTLPDDTYQLMTLDDYTAYVALYQTTYDAWYVSYLASLPIYTPPPTPVQVIGAPAVLTTEFERTDLDLKMARVIGSVVPGPPNLITIRLLVPGTFGVDSGRYIEGGYGMLDSYDPDDFVTVYVEDTDRLICSLLGLATDGSDDATVQGMGVLPGGLAAFGSLPNYPLIKSYADTDEGSGNQGWYFWPLAMGSTLPPIGEIEITPMGFYALVPPQLYLVFQVTRPNLTTGTLRADVFWAAETDY